MSGGALLIFACHAFPEMPVTDSTGEIDLIGNVVFAIKCGPDQGD